MAFITAELIKKKRRGEAHSADELRHLVSDYSAGVIPDYQMAAWLMAVCFQGLNSMETAILTEAMTHSGRTLDFSHLPVPAVDKHSTGGVGDKTSLIIAPLVAALGIPVPMMAGRGLGHTGGTLDKLESIPGLNVRLPLQEFCRLVEEQGTAIVGQTKEICPADLKLYALRDVTGTIDSIPLICASIMSKKLAEGIRGLVLDVKYGSGAFMKTLDAAKELAIHLKKIGEVHGLRVTAYLTNMNQPLGRYVGNALEIRESLEILQGKSRFENGIDFYADTRELSLKLAGEMIHLAGKSKTAEEGFVQAKQTLESGLALKKFLQICSTQGAKSNWTLPEAKTQHTVCAAQAGYVQSFDCESIGLSAIVLGAGRRRAEDPIDYASGIEVLIKQGQLVNKGQALFHLYTQRPDTLLQAEEILRNSVTVANSAPNPEPLISQILPAQKES